MAVLERLCDTFYSCALQGCAMAAAVTLSQAEQWLVLLRLHHRVVPLGRQAWLICQLSVLKLGRALRGSAAVSAAEPEQLDPCAAPQLTVCIATSKSNPGLMRVQGPKLCCHIPFSLGILALPQFACKVRHPDTAEQGNSSNSQSNKFQAACQSAVTDGS